MGKWIIYTLLAVNIVTFLVYGWDKLCARKDWWRVPERVLLGLAFLGGSPGALLGMRAFRHKTKHRKFTILGRSSWYFRLPSQYGFYGAQETDNIYEYIKK